MKILYVKTEQAGTIKTLFEVLKDLLPEGNLEWIRSSKAKAKNIEDSESEISESEQSDVEPKKKGKRTKKGKQESDLTKKVKDIAVESDESESSDSELESENEEEVEEQAEKGGLKIMAIDNSQSVLLHVKLDACNFKKFVCRYDRLVLGVNFSFLYQLIKFVDKNDELTFMVDDEEKDELKIRFKDNKHSNGSLTLMDLDEDEPCVPDTRFDVLVTMPSNEFQKVCRKFKTIGDYVQIKCINKEIRFICKGDHSSLAESYTEEEDNITILYATEDKDEPKVIQGVYELKNLVLFGKCASLCDDIQIFMKGSHPACILALKYTVATLGKLSVCLSPVNASENDSDLEESDDEEYVNYDKYYKKDAKVKYKQ